MYQFIQNVPLKIFWALSGHPIRAVTTTPWTVWISVSMTGWCSPWVQLKRHNVYPNHTCWPLGACVLASLGLRRWTIIYTERSRDYPHQYRCADANQNSRCDAEALRTVPHFSSSSYHLYFCSWGRSHFVYVCVVGGSPVIRKSQRSSWGWLEAKHPLYCLNRPENPASESSSPLLFVTPLTYIKHSISLSRKLFLFVSGLP